MKGALEFAPVVLEDGCDLGVGAIILPGVTVGKGAQVGAGAVVTRRRAGLRRRRRQPGAPLALALVAAR